MPLHYGRCRSKATRNEAIHTEKRHRLSIPYHVEHKGQSNLSRYTWSTDYHLIINEYLKRLIERLQIIDDSAQFSIHCDTSPLADRYMAYLAGLGFYGKNNCFISPKWGSYVVIGTILTTLELEPNAPLEQSLHGMQSLYYSVLRSMFRP